VYAGQRVRRYVARDRPGAFDTGRTVLVTVYCEFGVCRRRPGTSKTPRGRGVLERLLIRYASEGIKSAFQNPGGRAGGVV
jgi:hypothetical protein